MNDQHEFFPSSLHSTQSASLLLLGAFLSGSCGGTSASPESPTQAESASQASTSDGGQAQNHPPAVNAGQPISEVRLDDLEDGDNQIVAADGRGGYWYTYVDEGSEIEPGESFSPAEGGADGSKFAARIKGTIGDSVEHPFAGMGFSFVEPKSAYDVSSCDGIKFFAKKGPDTTTANMRAKVGDVNTVPEGGVCQDCYNDFGRDVRLTDEWTEITAPFFEMQQEPYWGEPRPEIVSTHVYQVQFQVKERGPFDIWVDEVRLYGCDE